MFTCLTIKNVLFHIFLLCCVSIELLFDFPASAVRLCSYGRSMSKTLFRCGFSFHSFLGFFSISFFHYSLLVSYYRFEHNSIEWYFFDTVFFIWNLLFVSSFGKDYRLRENIWCLHTLYRQCVLNVSCLCLSPCMNT